MQVSFKRFFANHLIVFALVVSLLSCSLGWSYKNSGQIDYGVVVPVVSKAVDQQLEVISPVLEENGVLDNNTRSIVSNSSGQEIVEKMLTEKNGDEYLAFSHSVVTESSSEQLLAEAAKLLPKEQFNELSKTMVENERSLRSLAVEQGRALPPNQRAEFLRDLQKLVTKTLVLLVAGVVYACIPTLIFWGKITAAAAISIAAGVVATTIMSIYRYYKHGDDNLSQSFQEWIVDVTTDPTAAWAIAASMSAVGKTMTNGPVVTGLIIVVFSIYQVMDLVKPMLKKYNFNA